MSRFFSGFVLQNESHIFTARQTNFFRLLLSHHSTQSQQEYGVKSLGMEFML